MKISKIDLIGTVVTWTIIIFAAVYLGEYIAPLLRLETECARHNPSIVACSQNIEDAPDIAIDGNAP